MTSAGTRWHTTRPGALSPLYELPARIDPLEPRFAVALLGVVLVTGGLIRLRQRWPAGLTAWIFSVLMLAPTSAVLRQGADLAPDRYTYLSGMGFAVLVGGAALYVIRLVRRGTLTRFTGRSAAIAGVSIVEPDCKRQLFCSILPRLGR